MGSSDPGMTVEGGACPRCEREGVVLLDGTLCERCHQQVWAEYQDATSRFGLFNPDTEGDAVDGGLVAVGVVYAGRAFLAWLVPPRSVEMYEEVDGLVEVYSERENVHLCWFS